MSHNTSMLQTSTILDRTTSEIKPNTDVDPYELSFLFSNEVVKYKCSCNYYRRLNLTYFCRHCMELRCRRCVSHEVNSQYCQHCLENISTIDPKFQVNKCASCHNCPNCQHLLSTYILTVSADSHKPDEVIKRTCQLVCEFCRWSSETFKTEGSIVSYVAPEVDSNNNERIADLISLYKAISKKEDDDKKKRRPHSRRGNAMDLLKKYGLDNNLSPKLFESLRARTNLYDRSASTTKYHLETKSEEEKIVESIKPAVALGVDEISGLDEEFYYRENFDIDQISSIDQRLAQVELQPEKASDFKPISKPLSVKHSLRCKECERNLCRSEFSPVSIRFKIQSAAYYHIPELRLKCDNYPIQLHVNQSNQVELTLQNHTLSQVKVQFKSIDGENEKYELELPQEHLVLEPRDETADYEVVPPSNTKTVANENNRITFQSPKFKIGFLIGVKPKIKTSEPINVEFLMTHDIMFIQNPRDNDISEQITHTVQVRLGPVD